MPARFRPLLLCCALAAPAASCVKLPRRQQTAGDNGSPPRTASAPAPPRVSINTASREELERLPGVGPSLAARIVEHRERFGPFRRVEHLLMVRGISERRFRQLSPHLTAE